MEKIFKYGDIIVATSGRDVLSCGIARGFGIAIFDHDISFEEAAERHLENMKKHYPGMFKDWTIDRVIQSMNKRKNKKYFIATNGDVNSYDNHELADSFDKLYIEGNIKLDKLCILKDKYIREHNVKPSKFPDDELSHYRIYDDVTNWINEHINDFE